MTIQRLFKNIDKRRLLLICLNALKSKVLNMSYVLQKSLSQAMRKVNRHITKSSSTNHFLTKVKKTDLKNLNTFENIGNRVFTYEPKTRNDNFQKLEKVSNVEKSSKNETRTTNYFQLTIYIAGLRLFDDNFEFLSNSQKGGRLCNNQNF